MSGVKKIDSHSANADWASLDAVEPGAANAAKVKKCFVLIVRVVARFRTNSEAGQLIKGPGNVFPFCGRVRFPIHR